MSLPKRAPRIRIGVEGLTLPEPYPVHLIAPFVLARYEAQPTEEAAADSDRIEA